MNYKSGPVLKTDNWVCTLHFKVLLEDFTSNAKAVNNMSPVQNHEKKKKYCNEILMRPMKNQCGRVTVN